MKAWASKDVAAEEEMKRGSLRVMAVVDGEGRSAPIGSDSALPNELSVRYGNLDDTQTHVERWL